MTDALRPRLAMLRAVVRHFDEHPALWASSTVITRNVDLLRGVIDALGGAVTGQIANDAEGQTEDKEALRDEAEMLLADLSAGATSLALETDDADLRELVDLSRTDWDRLAEEDFYGRADAVLARVEARAGDLAEYDVTKGEIDEARKAVDAARPGTAIRDNVRAARMVDTRTLQTGYGGARRPLRVLDLQVPRSVKDAAFVAEYRRVRRVTGV
ncbi:MAG TPA: hypothetical protein VF594_12015 [Rubricoccaceae bacterium]